MTGGKKLSLLFHHSIFSSLCVSKEIKDNNVFGTIHLLGRMAVVLFWLHSNWRHIVKKTTRCLALTFCSNVTQSCYIRTLLNGSRRRDCALPLQLCERAGQHCCRQTVHLCVCKVLSWEALHIKCSFGKH